MFPVNMWIFRVFFEWNDLKPSLVGKKSFFNYSLCIRMYLKTMYFRFLVRYRTFQAIVQMYIVHKIIGKLFMEFTPSVLNCQILTFWKYAFNIKTLIYDKNAIFQ